jgi:phosphodiesterase/alkaline phosphatase D-like protein
VSTEQLWLGALTDTSLTAIAKLNLDTTSAVLACRQVGTNTWVRSSGVASVGGIARMTVTGLTANTSYTCRVEPGTRPSQGVTGTFRTCPAAAGTACSYTVAFAGDVSELSNHAAFDTIRTSDPLMFFHLGDMHYNNITTNNVANYRAAYDEVFAQSRQSRLYRSVPTAYVWDDHDYSDNNSFGAAASHDAACAAYRERVPYYPLADATVTAHIGQTWDIGRVRYVMTDQRSAASDKAATDNSSKTMLGASQKTWFKSLLSASSGKLIVWICPRMFGGTTSAGADHWGGFTTERTEIGSHIHSNCPGRVIVLSADAHFLAIDDGSHHTYGSEPLRCFQAAPVDRSADVGGYGGSTYTSGLFTNLGQWGSMAIADSGGSSIGVTWRGFNSAGTQITSSAFTVNI